ncbi:glutathione-regulated potassium-efflux system protein KefC [Ottowia thiooxydans]|uniref:glutathione-regulated potassium-efflux system protein KefC n=1 Tax=Ottowia thiooxydans TaxID=219182 RepID=UPI00042010CC|nr:glutathione-regulated potassium-efflux system protein KefC [Ottowia thiooxydans]
MDHTASWMLFSLVFLGAAVIAVPIFARLGLGSIMGYLAAGIVIGPHALALVGDVEDTLHFAEFGVVMMLFLVGLELDPRRLWAMRRPIFGWGSIQVVGCAVVIASAATLIFGVRWQISLAAALGLALSSTASALQVMQERNLMRTTSGEAGFAILLFQDVAAIPILALLPLLGSAPTQNGDGWWEALRAVAAVVAILVSGRLLLKPLLRWIARSRTQEMFTATALLFVVGVSAFMSAVGLSMALGAFLAGVVLADSEYRHELETDIEPFKGLLLGLFFMAVGMSLDLQVLLAAPLKVLGILAGFMLTKMVFITLLARVMRLPREERPIFALLLAQGGEFAFVVFQTAVGVHVFPQATASLLTGAVVLSMLLTPVLLLLVDRLVLPRLARPPGSLEELSEQQSASVIIAGFGRYGQIVGRTLLANGLKVTVLDHDAELVQQTRRFDYRTFYGDATRLDLLRTAGAATAKVLVVAVDDTEQALKIIELAQEQFPQLQIVARARDVTQWHEIRDRGVSYVQREVFESSLRSARDVMQALGMDDEEADDRVRSFREHNLRHLELTHPVYRDEEAVLALNRRGRRELQDQMAADRSTRVANAAKEKTEDTAEKVPSPPPTQGAA